MTNYTFQSLLDFTRTTSGTFVGNNGLIQTTPASVNLLTYSQEFDNAAWTKSSTTVTANTTVAPDGTSTADTATETVANNFHAVSASFTFTAGITYTISIFAKQGSGTRVLQLYPSFAQGGNSGSAFNLVNGTVVTTAGTGSGVGAITNAGNGWYRCSHTFVCQTSGANTVFYGLAQTTANALNFVYTGDGTSGIFIWGAQLEVGSTATDYTRNNGGVYPARFDYDPATLQPKGILIEEQRVNLATGSADFTATYWPVATNAVVTADNTTSPDGTNNADRLADNTTAGVQHRIYRDYTFTAASHTLSVFAKRNDHRWLRLFFFDGTTSFFGNFDLLNGVVGNKQASTTTTITAFGNGWYRCTMTATTAAAAGNIQLVMLPTDDTAVPVLYTGTGTSLWLFGAQLEASSFATSYIPTVASQVTRTADQCSIVAPMFAPWYNQSEGTLLIEALLSPDVDGPSGNYYVTISDGTASNSMHIVDVSGTVSQVVTSGVTQFSQTVGAEPTGILKAALAYAANNTVSSANGAIGATDTSVSIPTVNRLSIGSTATLGVSLCGHIRSIRYYPVRLADFQLQALTA